MRRIGSLFLVSFKNKTEFSFHKSPILLTGFWISPIMYKPFRFPLSTCPPPPNILSYNLPVPSNGNRKAHLEQCEVPSFSLTLNTHSAVEFVSEWLVDEQLTACGQSWFREELWAEPLSPRILPPSLNCISLASYFCPFFLRFFFCKVMIIMSWPESCCENWRG